MNLYSILILTVHSLPLQETQDATLTLQQETFSSQTATTTERKEEQTAPRGFRGFLTGVGNGIKGLVEAPVVIVENHGELESAVKKDITNPTQAAKSISLSIHKAFKENPSEALGESVFAFAGLAIPVVGEEALVGEGATHAATVLSAADKVHGIDLTSQGLAAGSNSTLHLPPAQTHLLLQPKQQATVAPDHSHS